MKYLFFDIECADGGKATICSFGYVIADMDFKIIKREDIIINPEGRFFLTGRAGRPDVELAYPIERFKKAPTFPTFYNKIKALVENEEYYIVGHSIGDDVTYLNKVCARYELESFKFSYFDTQRMYRELSGEKKQKSLEDALLSLGVEDKFRSHQSVEDARATMLLMKALLTKANTTFEEFIEKEKCTGKTAEGKSAWDFMPPESEQKRLRANKTKGEKGDNVMLKGRRNHILFLRYLDYGEAIGEQSDKLLGKKVTISMNYETEHFKEMIILAGMIKAAGGEYVLMASRADVFATFEATDEEGNKRRCSRAEYVQAQVETGKEIEIISLEDLLSLLGTSFEALEASREIDVEYLLDDKYSKK